MRKIVKNWIYSAATEGKLMKYVNVTKPGKIGKLVLKNRMIMPAMCSYTANGDGSVSSATINHYARRAAGGVAAIVTEMTNPSPGCQVFPGNLDLSSDLNKPGFSRLAKAIHAQGAKCFVQLTHGGVFIRGAHKDAQTPSGIGTFSLEGKKLHIMTRDEIRETVEDYGKSAFRAKTAGFDGVEVHGAHGYLPSEFLSAYYNHRTDEYGGSLYNRARFSIEIIKSIHEYCGNDFPVIYKLPTEDFTPGGIDLVQSTEIAKMLEDAGAAAIVASGGTLESRFKEYMEVMNGERKAEAGLGLSRGISASCWIPSTYCAPRALYLENAEEIKKHIEIPVIAVCGIRPDQADELIGSGRVDFAALGRQILADPDYPTKVIEGRLEEMRQCLRCNECIGSAGKDINLSCSVNPGLGLDYTPMADLPRVEEPEKVAVIGSGPAGIEAAITAAARGHEVILFEKEKRLGGLLYYVCKPGFKEDYKRYADYLIHMLKKSNVEIRLGCEFTIDTAHKESFDRIIAATGSEVLIPNIEGAEEALDPLEILDGKIPDVNSFIVCGAGLVGCEVAMYLAEQGYEVTMVDILPDSHPAKLYAVDWSINAKLAEDDVQVKLGNKISRISATTVECYQRAEKMEHDPKNTLLPPDMNGPYEEKLTTYRADAVICALGLKSVNNMAYDLIEQGYRVDIIGDAYSPRKIIDAIHEAFHVGRRI